MDLWLANGTDQVQDFGARIPRYGMAGFGSAGFPSHIIPVGGQTAIYNLDAAEVTAIVSQHQKYGMVDVTQFPTTNHFIPYVYLIDLPVLESDIVALRAQNKKYLRAGT